MKLKTLFYSVLAVIALAVSSCKKDDPTPEEGSSASAPVFAVNGTVNGIPITLNAGPDGYFMATSFGLDSNGVYNFMGELKPKLCNGTCGNTLKITVKDYELSSAPTTNIDSTIVPGFYSYASFGGTASQYSQSFVGVLQSGGVAKSYTWDFGDNTIVVSPIPNVTHVYAHPGVYKVTLSIESLTGCVSTISNEVQFGQTGNSFIPQFITSYNGDTAIFTAIPIGGIPPFTYAWDFGDGDGSDFVNPSHEYTAPGVYKASLTMTDALGISSTQYTNVSINNKSICSSLLIAGSATPISNPLNLGNVVVEWKDADGRVWTSNGLTQQPSKSVFKIISVSDYIKDPSGGATKKIHIQFSCTLYSGFSSITMKNIDATFSVGYK